MSANSVANKLYPNHISVLLNIHNMPHWLNNNFQNSGAAPQGKLEKFPFFYFFFFFFIYFFFFFFSDLPLKTCKHHVGTHKSTSPMRL